MSINSIENGVLSMMALGGVIGLIIPVVAISGVSNAVTISLAVIGPGLMVLSVCVGCVAKRHWNVVKDQDTTISKYSRQESIDKNQKNLADREIKVRVDDRAHAQNWYHRLIGK